MELNNLEFRAAMIKNNIVRYMEEPIKKVLEARKQNLGFDIFLSQIIDRAISIDNLLSDLKKTLILSDP
jgi:hypothetical protein